MTNYQNGIPLPIEAEACDLLQAIKWVADLGYQSVIFESDCKNINC